MNIHTEEVTYDVGGVACKGYLAYDSARSGKRPGVLVVHEWWGQNDYPRRRARMLAELGYTALALDMFGEGKTAEHPDDAGRFMNESLSDMQVAEQRFAAARKLLEDHATTDAGKTAAIGYCFGGAIVLHMARRGMDLDGVASFHGSLGTAQPAKKGAVQAKLLVCHGAADVLVPKEQVDAFRAEMDAAGADLEFLELPGAKHGFTNPAADDNAKKFGLPLGYDKTADERSWAALRSFLDGLWK